MKLTGILHFTSIETHRWSELQADQLNQGERRGLETKLSGAGAVEKNILEDGHQICH